MNGRVLLVDDDESVLEITGGGLARRGYEVTTRRFADKALEDLESHDYDVVVTDLLMEGMDGIAFAKRVTSNRQTPVILLTGRGDMDAAILAIRAGVYDFLTKPVAIDVLSIAITRAIQHFKLQEEVKRLRRIAAEADVDQVDAMIGRSDATERLRELLRRIAPVDVSVLITGESGTGKELVARALHDRSLLRSGRFVAINCAAVPATLLETELFGHARGAFTDARQAKRGLFQQADGGTLFLDEIGDMPLEMQAKLLRALQEQRVRPVGGEEEVPFNARVVAATNRDLEDDIEEGRFREDLYYRINVVHIPVPPLRSRGQDILLLAQSFLERVARRSDRPVKGYSQAVAQRLLDYDWPGNIRELQNCMERAVAFARFEEVTVDDLPERIRHYDAGTSRDGDDQVDMITVEEMERRHIRKMLSAAKGNKSQAARILGFDRRTLYRRLERYGL